MSMTWLAPAALWGLALIAIPIAIHLLVRQQTRTVAYPSLRFVRETALAALRRRSIEDAVLLACRAAVVAAAALALAGPIVETPPRTAGYAARTSRAIVRLDDTVVEPALEQGLFRVQQFRRAATADAVADALRWLDAQPPSLREIVFAGALRKGQIARSDLRVIPAGVGVRFAGSGVADGDAQFTSRTLTRRDGRLVFATARVRLTADATQVETDTVTPAPEPAIRIVAAPKDQRLADAALAAALDAGLRWPDPNARVVVSWAGATDNARHQDARVVRMPVPDPPVMAATSLWNALDGAAPREAGEPTAIARADLDAWSRAPGPVSPTAVPSDEGDRRWFWAIVLTLLMLERWLRRDRAAAAAEEERRVA